MIAKDIIAIATSIIISVGGSGVIICALANFISERIAKRIDGKYQQRFEQEFEKYKSIMEYRRYISKTQFDNEYQIYKQLSKAFFSVAVKLSSFAYKRIGNRIISIEEDDIISMEEVSRIISVNSTAQNFLFENAPFIPEEIYNEYLALNELANTLFWGIIARIKEYEAECVEINKIITEDEIGMSEYFQNRLNDVNKKVRKYLETLTIIAD